MDELVLLKNVLKKIGAKDFYNIVDEILEENFGIIKDPYDLVSFAWIDNEANIHYLDGKTHTEFARSINKTVDELLSEKWIRVSNQFCIELLGRSMFKTKQFKAYVKNILEKELLSDDFIAKLKTKQLDIEKRTVDIFYLDGSFKLNHPFIDFLDEHDRGFVDKYFEIIS